MPSEFVKRNTLQRIICSLVTANTNHDPHLRFREDLINPLNEQAAGALEKLKNLLCSEEIQAETLHLTSECLPRGSIVMMDNRRWLHAQNDVLGSGRHLRRVRWDARSFGNQIS